MVGNNTPVFFVRDPMKFQHFIRSQKRRADNNLRDHDMQWDFWTLSPESAHQVTWLMGDRGIPRTWRHMNGYSSHTYMWINAAGERFWVKYHFMTDQGIEFFTQDEADQMAAADTDYHQRDLYRAHRGGDFPSWTLKMQIMPFEDAKTYRFNPFDLTKVWPHSDYPLIEVGQLTLDRNLTDYHTEIEQAAFEPNNLVPGIGLSPGQDAAGPRLLLLRRAPGPARRQLQADPGQLPDVAGPRYSKDGAMRVQNVSDPVYAPNSKGGPPADAEHNRADGWYADGDMVRAAYTLRTRGRRLGPGRHDGPGGAGRRRPRAAGRQHRRPSAQRGDRAGAERALRVLAQRRQGSRRPVESGVRAKQGEKDPKAAEQAVIRPGRAVQARRSCQTGSATGALPYSSLARQQYQATTLR